MSAVTKSKLLAGDAPFTPLRWKTQRSTRKSSSLLISSLSPLLYHHHHHHFIHLLKNQIRNTTQETQKPQRSKLRESAMAKPKTSSYEESRKQRLEENWKRMEALNLPQLAQALRTPPKPIPMKRTPKPKAEKRIVPVRRSSRVANLPAPPVYKEMDVAERVSIPRRYSGSTSKHRDLSNRVYAEHEDAMDAIEKAEKLEAELGTDYPTLVKTMRQSHVTGGFWLGLEVRFCKDYLSMKDEIMTLVDEDGNEYPVVYLARKTGLSGGWKGFAVAHDLVHGDAVVFQLIKPTTIKVYIIRVEKKA